MHRLSQSASASTRPTTTTTTTTTTTRRVLTHVGESELSNKRENSQYQVE